MKIVLKWLDTNFGESELRIYRGTSPLDTGNLPPPLGTVPTNSTEYVDYTVLDNTTYYYIIAAVLNGVEYYTPELEVYVEQDAVDSLSQGAWITSNASFGTAPESAWDPALTNEVTWKDRFQYTVATDILFDNFLFEGAGPVDTGVKTGVIEASPVDASFYIDSYNGSDGGTGALSDIDMEFLDVNDNPIAVLRFQKDGSYRHGIWYGDNFGALTKAPQLGSTPDTKGTLSLDANGFSFVRDTSIAVGSGKNDDFSYSNVNFGDVVKINIVSCRSYQDDSAGGSATWFRMERLNGVDLLQNAATTLNKATDTTTVSWTEGIPSATMEVNIYRSESPLLINDLPAPLTTIAGQQAIYSYDDVVPNAQANYYYLIELVVGGVSFFSDSLYAEYNPLIVGNIAHYKIENTSGGVLTDERGNFDATIFGTAVVNTGAGLDGNNTVSFTTDGAHASTGLDDEIDNTFADANSYWSVSAWFKGGQQLDDDGMIFGRGGGTGGGGNMGLFVGSSTGGGDNNTEAPDNVFMVTRGTYTDSGVDGTDNEWHFALATWDGDTETGIFRVDDKEIPIDRSVLANIQTGTYLAIGQHRGEDSPAGAPQPTYTYDGEIDNVRVYNKYLTAEYRARLEAELRMVSSLAVSYSTNAGEVTLSWYTGDPNLVTNVVVYRDTAPIDPGALPTALATITGGVESYIDTTFALDTTYHYLIDVQTSGPTSHYSKSVSVLTNEGFLQFEPDGQMVWFDASDLSTLFQDTSGTTPVTTDGDAVQRWNDKSSNNYDAIIDSGTAVYRTDGTKHWVEFSAARFTFPQFINGTIDRTFAFLGEVSTFGGNDGQPLMDLQTALSGVTSGLDWTVTLESTGLWIRVDGNNQFSFTPSLNTLYNVYVEWGTSLGTNVTDSVAYRDNALITDAGGVSAIINTNVTTNSFLGGSERQTGKTHFTGNMRQVFLIDTLLNQTDRTTVSNILEEYR